MSATNTHKIAIKFYAKDANGLTDHDFVPVLHTWIQSHAVPDHMLIDVADYAHVQNGPGTLLVSHEANFYIDRLDGSLGLTYSRKQPVPDAATFQDRLTQALIAALQACARLEDAPQFAGRLKFRTDEVAIFINDRLLAPNTLQTFNEVKPDLEQTAAQLFPGANVDIEHYASEETLFEAHLRANESPDIATLLSRLGAEAPAPAR